MNSIKTVIMLYYAAEASDDKNDTPWQKHSPVGIVEPSRTIKKQKVDRQRCGRTSRQMGPILWVIW